MNLTFSSTGPVTSLYVYELEFSYGWARRIVLVALNTRGTLGIFNGGVGTTIYQDSVHLLYHSNTQHHFGDGSGITVCACPKVTGGPLTQ